MNLYGTAEYLFLYVISGVLSSSDDHESITLSLQFQEPSCSAPNIAKSYIKTKNVTFYADDTVEVFCEEGYRFPHFKSHLIIVKCQYDGTWIDVLGRQQLSPCEKIGSCPLPGVEGGEVLAKSGGYRPGEIAPVRCDVTTATHSYNIICQNDGTWKSQSGYSDLTYCAVKNCSLPPVVKNGQYHLLTPQDGHYFQPAKFITSIAMLNCNEGYVMEDEDMALLSCLRGSWDGVPAKCVLKKNTSLCQKPNMVPDSYYSVYGGSNIRKDGLFGEGATVVYFCDTGFKLYGTPRRMCANSKWTGAAPECIPGCNSPPIIAHANYNFFGQHSSDDRIAEGSYVYYYCDDAFRMQSKNMSALKCQSGLWQGTMPVCEKRNECDTPMDIPHGNWIILSLYSPNFRIGSRVQYECNEGFKAIGVTEIECLSTGYWSDYVPRCLVAEEYCSEPEPLENGFYMCKPNDCNLFHVGTEIHYICGKEYEPGTESISVMTCQVGGTWSEASPSCIKVETAALSNPLNMTSSTLTVVIVTSCCVLGLLFLVIVVVIIQRRRQHSAGHGHHGYLSHLHDPNQPHHHHHPGYERVSDARVGPVVDENDRVALIAFADGVQIVLPTYEEAIRTSNNGSTGGNGSSNRPSTRLHRYNSDSSRGSGRSTSTRSGGAPQFIRSSSHMRGELPPGMAGDLYHHHQYLQHQQRDHPRNSVITTGSAAMRGFGGDNLSLAFGSMDTVNISDNTSTTVTLGTYDSGASNPSLSLRAVTGSMASANSNPSVADTEDAPLIEPSSEWCPQEVLHRSQTASPSIPEEIIEEEAENVIVTEKDY